MNSYKSGLWAEWVARMYLRMHGFRVLDTRFMTGRNTGRAEIDIIARRKNLVVFVEVKSRPTLAGGLDAISAPQMRRLRAGAENWIMRRGWRGDARFDAIIVSGWRVKWIQQMF